MGVENPAVTTCFELYRPSSAKISAAMVSLRKYWRYIPQRTLATIPSNQFFLPSYAGWEKLADANV